MDNLIARGPHIGRVYAAFTYFAAIALLFGAAVLTGTFAREAFIFVFVPGALLSALTPFIWSGSRAAMILALVVAAVLALITTGSSLPNRWFFVLLPIVCAALTVLALFAVIPRAETNWFVADEVYAALVYFAGLWTAFMAPFNHSRLFGWPGIAIYVLIVSLSLGLLSALIWRGKAWAMVAACAASLAHWIVLARIDSSLWPSAYDLAAPIVSGILTAISIASARRRKAAAGGEANR
jgi:hypothetical protein